MCEKLFFKTSDICVQIKDISGVPKVERGENYRFHCICLVKQLYFEMLRAIAFISPSVSRKCKVLGAPNRVEQTEAAGIVI